MKKVMIAFLVFSTFVLSSNLAIAQQGTKLSEDEKKQLKEQITQDFERLNLSEDQKEVYKEISFKYAQKLKSVKEMGGSRYSKYQKVKSIRDAKNAEMKKVLSKKQYKVYLEIQKKRMEEMKSGRR